MSQGNGEVKIPGTCFVVEKRAKSLVLGETPLWMIPSLHVTTPLEKITGFQDVKRSVVTPVS